MGSSRLGCSALAICCIVAASGVIGLDLNQTETDPVSGIIRAVRPVAQRLHHALPFSTQELAWMAIVTSLIVFRNHPSLFFVSILALWVHHLNPNFSRAPSDVVRHLSSHLHRLNVFSQQSPVEQRAYMMRSIQQVIPDVSVEWIRQVIQDRSREFALYRVVVALSLYCLLDGNVINELDERVLRVVRQYIPNAGAIRDLLALGVDLETRLILMLLLRTAFPLTTIGRNLDGLADNAIGVVHDYANEMVAHLSAINLDPVWEDLNNVEYVRAATDQYFHFQQERGAGGTMPRTFPERLERTVDFMIRSLSHADLMEEDRTRMVAAIRTWSDNMRNLTLTEGVRPLPGPEVWYIDMTEEVISQVRETVRGRNDILRNLTLSFRLLQDPVLLVGEDIRARSDNIRNLALTESVRWLPDPVLWNGTDQCPICLETMNGTMVRQLPCRYPLSRQGHVFHTGCIDRHVTRDTRCPMCRQDIRTMQARGNLARIVPVPVGP
ncbi:unnamed protein product (mitochondrion) [Plasmodiophora brassicae]|uniref:RING-type domain-containing protein n=1 Tax=Plasmodiophora brassicae TaxID=37360 RepID=A0A0G4J8X7_PLABS|nr:hypothetical protein PBRA_003456 [Plasmodiophora brassicae]SPQ99808.1 unnamed protein product [Plasmodiophora brassicae]